MSIPCCHCCLEELYAWLKQLLEEHLNRICVGLRQYQKLFLLCPIKYLLSSKVKGKMEALLCKKGIRKSSQYFFQFCSWARPFSVAHWAACETVLGAQVHGEQVSILISTVKIWKWEPLLVLFSLWHSLKKFCEVDSSFSWGTSASG